MSVSPEDQNESPTGESDTDPQPSEYIFAPSVVKTFTALRARGCTPVAFETGRDGERTWMVSECPVCPQKSPLAIFYIGGSGGGAVELNCDGCTFISRLNTAMELGLSPDDLYDVPEPLQEAQDLPPEPEDEVFDPEDEIAAMRERRIEKQVEELRVRDEAKRRFDEEILGRTEEDFEVLDLHELRTGERPERVWLENKLIAVNQVTKITADSGAGKTLLLANLALCWSLGRSLLDVEDGGPRMLEKEQRVLYIDGEVGQDWWAEYLDKFDAPLDLPNLFVKSFPDWPPLTTDTGADLFWKLVDKYDPDVVVMDTLSSFIDGEESDSTTWILFDNRVTLPLKARGITTVFADHTGHEAQRARGSSAKKSKLDVEWVLSGAPKGSDSLELANLKSRTGGLPEKVSIRRADNPLAHVRLLNSAAAPGGQPGPEMRLLEVVALLDRLGVPFDIGRPRVRSEYLKGSERVSDRDLSAAIARRKAREDGLRKGAQPFGYNPGEYD
jgi:hypothetical protein